MMLNNAEELQGLSDIDKDSSMSVEIKMVCVSFAGLLSLAAMDAHL